jgi:Lrp/AsnC family leucine-responsive transcriptional regulator/Lrp/AsnC family transcriptional regulator
MTPQPKPLDDVDAALLRALQHNATQSHTSLAQAVGLSVTGVHKRIKRLERQGIIQQTVVMLDRERLGLDLLCFLTVSFKANTNPSNMNTLTQACAGLPQVLECYTLTGINDAILKVLVRDHKALREFLAQLSSNQNVIERVQTSIVLEEIKETHELMIE